MVLQLLLVVILVVVEAADIGVVVQEPETQDLVEQVEVEVHHIMVNHK